MTCYFLSAIPEGAIGTAIADIDALPRDYYLARRQDGLFALHDRQQRHPPLSIDFADAYYRCRGGTEYLPKAFKGMAGACIADTTAGWGRDAWLLAYRGFQVYMLERNPYLAYLLSDALQRAREDSRLRDVAMRLHIQMGDSTQILQKHMEVDAVYLDPMFPERRKQAKVKKHMQALHLLLGGEESDGGILLHHARQIGRQRIVVKRPQSAPYLGEAVPHHSLNAPNTRYDIYLPYKA